MEEKLNEYKLKLYQHFAFILYGSSALGLSLFDSTDINLLKDCINEMKNAMPLPMFYYKAGIATDTVLQEAIRYDGQDCFKISCDAMSVFIEEIGICSEMETEIEKDIE